MKIKEHEKIDDKSPKAVLDRITIICAVLTIIISSIILAGWLFNLFDISRLNQIYKPMSSGSALSFIVLGCALLVYFYFPVNHTARKLAKVAVALSLVVDMFILVDFIFGRVFDIEIFILPQLDIVNKVFIGWKSPITAASYVISSLALFLLLFSPDGKKQTKSIAAYLASVSLYIGIIVFIGYLYGTPLLYGGTTIPTSLFTAICFQFLSVGIITAAGKEYLPLRMFIGDSVRARLMRSFIPVIIGYILLEGILKIVLLPYSDENVIESSIMVIFFFLFGGLITSRIAQKVGGDVDRKDLIQRERAACALRESELKFRTIFETVPEGLGLTRLKDGMLIDSNNGLSQMFGYTKDELIGKSTWELNFLVDPDDRNKMLEQLQSSGFAYGMEVKYRKKNGEISTGTYSAAKLLVNNEPHLIISTRDISKRKRAEEMLRQSEEKYRGLIENIKDGIFIIQDAKLKFINEAFARIAGYSAEEIIGMDFRDLVAPEDKELVVDRYTRRLKGEKVPDEYEFRLIRKDGTIITVDMNVGAFSYFGSIASIGILKDITQRKRVEEALHASEEKFSKAFHSSPQSISITTLNDGRIIEINDSITKSLGFSREEAIEHTTVELGIWITPEDRIRFVDSFKKNGYVRNMELDLRAKKGNILSMLLSSELIDVVGKACMLSTFYDITERKRAEEELEETIMIAQNEKNKSEAIIAALGDGIIIQDTDYIITYQNKLQTEIYGEHAGEHCYKVYENRDTICEDCPVEKTFLDGKVHRTERSVPTGGKMLYYELTSSPLRDSSGKIIAGVKMVRDITDRKLSEERLKLHDNRLKDILELHRLGDATEKDMFDFALSASLRTVQSEFAFIGLMTADEAVMINRAWSKKVMSDCQISEKPVEYQIAQAGLWGEVVRQRRPIIVNDYSMTKEFKKGCPRGHVPIKRLLGIPIISGTRIVAVACVANKTSDYTQSDAIALTSLIHEMWNILEQRRIEGEVSKNRAMLLKAQEIGHVGSWEWNIATNDLVWTKEVYNVYGLDPDIVKPKYDLVLNTMSPENKAEFLKSIDDAIKLKNPFEMEYSLIRPDGSKRYIHTKGEVLFDSEGNALTIFGMVQDITQSKQAQEDLRKSEERFRKLFETEPECVKLLAQDNTLIDMNPAGLGMIEADSLVQVEGKSIMGIIDPAYREAFEDVTRSIFKGKSASLEFSINGLKGTKRWLETHAVPLRDDCGKINFLLAVTRDVTERKLAQEERIQLLERDHEARTEVEAARKLDRMKSMFIASTSHELRTPLNSVIGFSSMLLEGYSGQLTPEQKELLEIVHSSGKHLLTLINDIIDISQIEAGNVRVEVCEFKLGQVVDEAVSMLKVSLSEKKLDLKVNVQDIVMRSDRRRLFQCIVNLLSNAIKYTEKGSVEITVKVISNNVIITVSDTGIGIKTDDIQKLFGPFVRLPTPLTYKTSGTGLGLYLVKKLAKDFLGGDVEVKSEFGQGSTFMMRIPVELEGKV